MGSTGADGGRFGDGARGIEGAWATLQLVWPVMTAAA